MSFSLSFPKPHLYLSSFMLHSYFLSPLIFMSLLLSNAAISLGNAFISLEISSQFFIFFSLFLQDYISFIFSLVFFFLVFSFGVVVFLLLTHGSFVYKFISLKVLRSLFVIPILFSFYPVISCLEKIFL